MSYLSDRTVKISRPHATIRGQRHNPNPPVTTLPAGTVTASLAGTDDNPLIVSRDQAGDVLAVTAAVR